MVDGKGQAVIGLGFTVAVGLPLAVLVWALVWPVTEHGELPAPDGDDSAGGEKLHEQTFRRGRHLPQCLHAIAVEMVE